MANANRQSLWKEWGGQSGWSPLRLILKFWTAGFAVAALTCWAGVAIAVLSGQGSDDVWLFRMVAAAATVATVACWRIAFR